MRRACLRLVMGVAGKLLELLAAPGIAEDDLVASSREKRAELAAHQPGTENPDAHGFPSLPVVPLRSDSVSAVDEALQLFRVAGALHGDLGQGAVDVADV